MFVCNCRRQYWSANKCVIPVGFMHQLLAERIYFGGFHVLRSIFIDRNSQTISVDRLEPFNPLLEFREFFSAVQCQNIKSEIIAQC